MYFLCHNRFKSLIQRDKHRDCCGKRTHNQKAKVQRLIYSVVASLKKPKFSFLSTNDCILEAFRNNAEYDFFFLITEKQQSPNVKMELKKK